MGNITMHGEGHAVCLAFPVLDLSRAKREDDFFLLGCDEVLVWVIND